LSFDTPRRKSYHGEVNPTRWAVAIPSKRAIPEQEHQTAICRCLQRLGHPNVPVQDGETAGYEADVLLLLVSLGFFPEYCRRLRSCGSRRPITVAWLMDPLPPENLPLEAEAAGLKASRWGERFHLHQSAAAMPRWKKIYTLLRLREWLCRQCSTPGYRKASRLIKRAGGGDFAWQQVREVMTNWRMILEADHEGWVDHFAVSTNQRRRFLAGRGIYSAFIPMGAHDGMGRNLGRLRDIPVGFLGAIRHGRRVPMLKQLRERLKEKGIPLDQRVGRCYGEQRCEWLNRTRILVSLHRSPWNHAWIRFLIAAKCGTLVVSEPMNDEHPMVAGVHYVAATADEMPEVIAKLLDDPAKIRQVTSAAADLCQHELTLLRATEKLIALSENANSEGPARS